MNPSKEQSKYWAFISYSHQDQQWGNWLHKALETYRVPRKLVGSETRLGKVPRRLSPVFLDQEELPTSPDLGANLKEGLERSRLLIVICSPHSAKSVWVNEEIRQFKVLGRENRILALIVDGEPNASDKPGLAARECFPEALRYLIDEDGRLTDQRTEPIAADVRPGHDSKKIARLRLIAGMIGIDFASLHNRHKRRRRIRGVQIALLLLSLLMSGLLFYGFQADKLHRQEKHSRWVLYHEKIAEANRFLSDGRFSMAQRSLWQTPAEWRHWEWSFLLHRASMELATLPHANDVFAVRFSPDGDRIVTASSDKRMHLWDAWTGKELSRFPLQRKTYGGNFSEDGKRFRFLPFDESVRIIDPASGRELFRLGGGGKQIQSAAFNPGSTRIVTGSQDGTVKVWDATTGDLALTLTGHDKAVYHTKYDPTGRFILTVSEDITARLWDARTGTPLHQFAGYEKALAQAQFSPDGKRLFTASRDSTATLWNTETGTPVTHLKGEKRRVHDVSFSERGDRMVVRLRPEGIPFRWEQFDRTASVRRISDGAEVSRISGHADAVLDVAISPDGRFIATASNDTMVKLWDAGNGKELDILLRNNGTAYDVLFSANGDRLAALVGGKVYVWEVGALAPDLSRWPLVATIAGHDEYIDHMDISADGRRVVTGSRDNTARIWDATLGLEMATHQGSHPEIAEGKAFRSGDPTRFLTRADGQVLQIRELKNHQLLGQIEFLGNPMDSAVLSPDHSRVLLTHKDGHARLWDMTSQTVMATLTPHRGTISDSGFSSDGHRVVTASLDGTAHISDANSGRIITTLRHPDAVNKAAFSPNGQQIATVASNKTVRLWNSDDGELLQLLQDSKHRVSSILFSPDGSLLATTSTDGSARLWNTASGDEQARLVDGSSRVSGGTSFNNDGTLYATGHFDGSVRLWNSTTGQLVKKLSRHTDAVSSLRFSSGDHGLLTSARDGMVIRWHGPTYSNSQVFDLNGTSAWPRAEFAADDKHIVAWSGNTVKRWDIETHAELAQQSAPGDADIQLAFANGDQTEYAIMPKGSTALLVDAASNRVLSILSGHEGGIYGITSAVLSPDGKQIVTTCDDLTSIIWDSASGRVLQTLKGHTKRPVHALFSPDSKRVLTVATDNTARLWDAATGKTIATLQHKKPVKSAVFSQDGSQIVTASLGRNLKAWNGHSGAYIGDVQGQNGGSFNNVEYSPDGQYLIGASSDRTVTVWDTATFEIKKTLRGHSAAVSLARYSPDGKRIVTLSGSTAKIWSAYSGIELVSLPLEGKADAASFSPDGEDLYLVYSSSGTQRTEVWGGPPFRLNDLPGDPSQDGKERFSLWKSSRLRRMTPEVGANERDISEGR